MRRYRTLVPSILLASSLGLLAAPVFAAPQKCGPSEMRGDFMEHRLEHMEQHHKKLHAALKLMPEQEVAWKKLMDSESPMVKAHQESHEHMATLTTPERAEKMLERMKDQQAHLAAHVAAITEFYSVLTPEQKKTFDEFHSGAKGEKGEMHGKHGHHSSDASRSANDQSAASTSKHESAGAYIDDSAITAKVKAALLKEPTLKSGEIKVETYKGVTQLTGFVSSRASIDKAAEIARSVKGVTSVKNDMIVKGQQ